MDSLELTYAELLEPLGLVAVAQAPTHAASKSIYFREIAILFKQFIWGDGELPHEVVAEAET